MTGIINSARSWTRSINSVSLFCSGAGRDFNNPSLNSTLLVYKKLYSSLYRRQKESTIYSTIYTILYNTIQYTVKYTVQYTLQYIVWYTKLYTIQCTKQKDKKGLRLCLPIRNNRSLEEQFNFPETRFKFCPTYNI